MLRDENYFSKELKNDKILEEVFMQLGNMSVIRTKNEDFDFFEEKNQSLDELTNILTVKLEKNKAVIQHYIDILIKWGLVKYVVDDEKGLNLDNGSDKSDEDRYNFFKNKGFPKKDCSIVLTKNSILMRCTGVSLYSKIIHDKESEEAYKSYGEAFSSIMQEILDPYKKEIAVLKEEIEEKINKVNKEIDNGIIKNIQVLSIFAGMISLLFANILGIKEFALIGIKGLLIINISVVIALFSLLLFSKWIVIGEKIGLKQFLKCIAILSILYVPIFLVTNGLLK